jgi:hypothetical protein
MAVRGTADNARWELSHRWLSGQIPRATHRTVVTRQLHRDVKAGVEWNSRAHEVGFVANWRIRSETPRGPAVILGTSSDRIGTPHGQAYFVTVSKSLHHQLRIPVAPYVGASYSSYEKRMLYPFGVNVAIGERWSAMLLNDGVHTHVTATRSWRRLAVTLLAVERKDFGISIGTRF